MMIVHTAFVEKKLLIFEELDGKSHSLFKMCHFPQYKFYFVLKVCIKFHFKMTIFLENIEFLLNNRVRVSYVTLESRQVNGIFQNYMNGI
jgi:hypothetical protein